jgi:hypothetical protein
MNDDLRVGDVIQLNGPSVPTDLRDKWFRVEATSWGTFALSPPYHDPELTRPYHPTRPVRLTGWNTIEPN